jgi:hypothetical protein
MLKTKNIGLARNQNPNLPHIVTKVLQAAEDFHGQSLIGTQLEFPANYTPFHQGDTPRYTRYFTDGRVANIEVEVNRDLYSVRVYGATVHQFHDITPWEDLFPIIVEDEKINVSKFYDNIEHNGVKFYRAHTLQEIIPKFNFLNEIQKTHIQLHGEILEGLPIAIDYQPIELDVERYSKSFIAEGIASREMGSESAKKALLLNLETQPYQMTLVHKDSSLRLRDWSNIFDDEQETDREERFLPTLLNLYKETELTEDSLERMVKKLSNRLVKTITFIHNCGYILWKESENNSNMGIKDVSLTGVMFDPEPALLEEEDEGAGGDNFEVVLAITTFLYYFSNHLPEETLLEIGNRAMKNIGVTDDDDFYRGFLTVNRLENRASIQFRLWE